jgi:ubiquinol-cytochrome c reductase cytochrome c1 subunit
MVRPIAMLAGLGFVVALLFGFFAPREAAVEDVAKKFYKHPKEVSFKSDGPFGKFDERQLQRGFQVFNEVCSSCHSLNQIAFYDLAGLGYNEAEIKAIAASKDTIPDVSSETGEATTRKGLPKDKWPSPYANDVAARLANNNAIPPDLSLITKAREGGGPYIYSLLTGYQEPPANLPADKKPGPGLNYNPYFHSLNIAMAAPLITEGQVTYSDGTKATVDQMARDVSAFLIWTAEPKMQVRKQTGWFVIAFLLIATILAYLSYKSIWADKKSEGDRDAFA